MAQPIRFTSATELRAWFHVHADTADELWVGLPRKSSRLPGLTWSQVVDEALCVGWIDSVSHPVDDQWRMQRFSPRRPRSNWSAVNVAKVAQLTAEGRMRPAGLAAFERRTAARTGVYSFEQPDIDLPPGTVAALEADPAARAFWERQPPSYRKPATWWLLSAKKPETRRRRAAQLVADCAAGVRVKHLRRP